MFNTPLVKYFELIICHLVNLYRHIAIALNKYKYTRTGTGLEPLCLKTVLRPSAVYGGGLHYNLFLPVQTEHTDEDGAKAQHLTANGANGKIGNVIYQPGRGADQAIPADRLRVTETEADGGGGHANDRQKFHKEIDCGGLLAK